MIACLGADEPLPNTLSRLRAAGRTPYVVGGETKRELLASFAAALDFPQYFGHNLDALADSLTEVRWRTPATIVWVHAATLARVDYQTFSAVEQILASRLPDGVDVLLCLR